MKRADDLDVKSYYKAFIDTGFLNPRQCPEPGVIEMMAFAQHQYSAIGRANVEQGVLCIELGVVSNKATYASSNGVHMCCVQLGTSLIEQMMLNQNLKDAYRKGKKAHNDPKLLQAVIDKCKSDRKFYNYILLQTRKLKESYYSANADGAVVARDIFGSVELDWQDPVFSDWDFFTLYTNDTMMDAITKELSIRAALGDEFNKLPNEMQNEIGNKTYAECLHDFFIEAMGVCSISTRKAKDMPIILSFDEMCGSFVEDILTSIFPKSTQYWLKKSQIENHIRREKHMARYIHSLDNGRGTMAAFTGEDMVPVPKPLMSEGGEQSGFAKMKDGSYMLGTQLYNMNGDTYHDVDSFMIDFKEIPNKDNHELLVTYARAWRERMMKQNPTAFLPGNEEYWIIGMPTGWRKKSILDAYRQVFIDAGYKNPIIVPESNAAMAAAQHNYSAIARANVEQGVLCIDLGAYSNDATFVNKDGVSSYGGYTGASLIERMMLVQNLKDAYRKRKTAHNAPELLQTVIDKCRSDRKFYNYILLQTRKLKETYYSANADGAVATRDIVVSVELDWQDSVFSEWDGENFTLYTNDTMMNAITKELSIRSVLGDEFNKLPSEMQNEIGNKTWAGCLRTFIEKATELCPLLAQAARGNQTEKAPVVLTGGAGLMPFVEDVILEVLPNIDLYKDRSPVSTIAQGLWYFGPEKLKQLDFERAFDAVLNEEDSDGNSTLNIILSKAHNILGSRINHLIVEKSIEYIAEAAGRWSKHEFDSTQIISNARTNLKKWFNDGLKVEYAKHAAETKQFIITALNDKFRGFLDGSSVENTELFKDDELSLNYIESYESIIQEYIFDGISELISKHDELYSLFPNPSRLKELISPSRAQYLQAYADQLGETYAKWGQSVCDALKDLFDSPELYRPFAVECIREMMTALESKKQTMLGALIIEDSVEDD